MKLKEIVSNLGGELIIGGDEDVTGICTSSSQKFGCIFAISDNIILKNAMTKPFLGIAAVVGSRVKGFPSFPHIITDDVRDYQRRLIDLFSHNKPIIAGISKLASVGDGSIVGDYSCVGDFTKVGINVTIGKNTQINDNVSIGDNVHIGDGCFIASGVRIYDNVRIGNNVRLHSNTVIGADGFGYVQKNVWHKIKHIGSVIIEDDVEIGANSCVDRGTIDDTFIGCGTKIDNLVQVAHNCYIGKNCTIAGSVALSGSVKLGDNVMVGGQVGFRDNITITSNVGFAAGSGVHHDILTPGFYGGFPVVPMAKYRRYMFLFERLPEMKKKIDMLISNDKDIDLNDNMSDDSCVKNED